MCNHYRTMISWHQHHRTIIDKLENNHPNLQDKNELLMLTAEACRISHNLRINNLQFQKQFGSAGEGDIYAQWNPEAIRTKGLHRCQYHVPHRESTEEFSNSNVIAPEF